MSAVGEAVRRALDMPHGERPNRIVVDPQNKGVEDLNAMHRAKQFAFFRQLRVDDLMSIPPAKR